MVKRTILSGVVTCSIFIFTSCVNSSEQKSQIADSTSTTQMHKTTDTVIIEGMQFKPKQLTVYKGDTIIWINNDIVAHNVTEDTAQTWTSDSIDIGKTWTMIPSKSFNYLCSIHPTMKGVVTVIER
jgi:plastocyanin